MTLPYSAIWSAAGQDVLRSADIVTALVEENLDEFQVWGQFSMAHCSPPGAPAHEIKVVEIAVPAINDVEQVRLAVAKARGINDEWEVRPLEPMLTDYL